MSKTAMKEMLLNIEALEAITTDQEQIYMLTHLKVGALVLFKKEKEQIIDAFWNGDNSDCTSEQNAKEFAEEYYNQTYNQDSELPKEDKTFKRKSQWTEVDNMTKRLK